jgi:Lipase
MVQLVQMLLKHRGGCIVIMDWTKYSNNLRFFDVVNNDYKKVSNAFARRLTSLEASGVSPDNIFLYGFSMGARIFIDAAITFGPGKIGEIDGEKTLKGGKLVVTKFPSNSLRQCRYGFYANRLDS